MIILKWWLKWRVTWSNFLFKDKDIKDCDVEEKVSTIAQLHNIAKEIYKVFTYKYDEIIELGDSMHTPAQCYIDYKQDCFADDCDGFHAALYHVAAKNKINCYLLTYIAEEISSSHTLLLVKSNNRFYIFNYDSEYICGTSPNDVIDFINRRLTKIKYYNLVKYDYENNKYKVVTWGN